MSVEIACVVSYQNVYSTMRKYNQQIVYAYKLKTIPFEYVFTDNNLF